ncbi:MAG: zf-HC2 domain-containing protein [Phycisphaerales bacterium]
MSEGNHNHPSDGAEAEHRVGAFGCDMAKAALSAYLDGELETRERLAFDAHILGCGGCRGLVERAERLDESLREKFASDLADAPVDTDAMHAGVLAAIGAQASANARFSRRPVAGWLRGLAVAALLAFAFVAGWIVRAGDSASAEDGAGGARLVALDPDERQLLYSTGVILHHIRRDDFERSSEFIQLREVARYDELVDRLDSLLEKVPEEERPTIALARDVIGALVESAPDADRWEAIRSDLERTELDRRVDVLSDA